MHCLKQASSRFLLVAMILGLVSGCSFFDKKDESIEPAKLQSFKAEVKIEKIWSRDLGAGAEDRAIKLVPAIEGSRVYGASADGNVVAVESGTGKIIWKQNIVDFYDKQAQSISFSDDIDAITGGVGLGSDLVVVGSAAGEIVAMHTQDGSLAWRAKTSSEVLSQPQVGSDRVFVQSIDGKVAAYSAETGERIWSYSTSIPSLTLRGTSTPIMSDDFIIAGFANGRVAMLSQEQGLVGVEQRVGVSQGKSDLERLVDIDGQMLLLGSNLYVASYQGNLLAIDLTANGRVRWGREASSSAGLTSGFGNIYIVYDDGRIGAIDLLSNKDVWEISDFLNRYLTTPATVGSYLAVGDFEGYLHLVAQADGRLVGRRKLDGAGLTAPMVVDGNRIYIIGDSGELMALEVR